MLEHGLLASLDPAASSHPPPIEACCRPHRLHYALRPSRSMAALRQPSDAISSGGPHSPSSCRDRIKARKITLLRPYGASIGLGQRTLNCNSAVVEGREESGAPPGRRGVTNRWLRSSSECNSQRGAFRETEGRFMDSRGARL